MTTLVLTDQQFLFFTCIIWALKRRHNGIINKSNEAKITDINLKDISRNLQIFAKNLLLFAFIAIIAYLFYKWCFFFKPDGTLNRKKLQKTKCFYSKNQYLSLMFESNFGHLRSVHDEAPSGLPIFSSTAGLITKVMFAFKVSLSAWTSYCK